MNDEQRIANNARLSETEAQLAEVVQKYKEYQNMLEPFLGRVDLSDAEKEAIARIETLMAQAAQERDNLRKEQLALIQNAQIQKKKQKRIPKESVDTGGWISLLLLGSSSSLYKQSTVSSREKTRPHGQKSLPRCSTAFSRPSSPLGCLLRLSASSKELLAEKDELLMKEE
ncbi:hypothetical protein MP638_004659 [Amoeboaphelidium occidentale]|nr:hypothetical protein MP638_004659 [Amoeboaphelidium occidentale]